jgi:hypothetical protein
MEDKTLLQRLQDYAAMRSNQPFAPMASMIGSRHA